MTTLYNDDYVAYELAQLDRAALLQMAQRRGACVSDLALEAASRAAVARLAYLSLESGSGLGHSHEDLVRDQFYVVARDDDSRRAWA